jgi:hypothetical protein
MDLSKILSVGGKPGLYKLIAQSKTGLIVESLIDQKRFPTHIADKVNNLEDITVYLNDKDIPLKDVLITIFKKENGGPAIDSKSDDKTLKAYFESVLPDYDKERVYVSDIKKIIGWYNLLQKMGLITLDEENKDKDTGKEPDNSSNVDIA